MLFCCVHGILRIESCVLCVLVQGMVLHDKIENPCVFEFVFTHSLAINKNHTKIKGRHLVIISSFTTLRDTLTPEEDHEVNE
jgi:hypothetical protein